MDRDRITATFNRRRDKGQAVTEYALILALVVVALAAAFIATGSVIDDIFSNAVAASENVNDPAERDQIAGFQETLAWIAANPATGVPDELNPEIEPTDLPEGVTEEPPPAIETTGVPPELTPTLVPSATPEDVSFNLTYNDSADNTEDRYRLEGNAYIGLQATTARFFQDNSDNSLNIANLEGKAFYYQNTGEPNPVHEQALIAPGDNVPGVNEQFFSAQFRREVWITQDETLTITINDTSGGVRVYYEDGGSCSNFRNTISPLDGVARNTENGSSCVLIDEWVDVPDEDNLSATRTFSIGNAISALGSPGPNPGPEDGPFYGFVLWIEFYNRSAAVPSLNVTIDTPRQNTDDAGLNGATVQCNWGKYEGDRSNVRPFSWYAAVGLDDFPDNQRCHLELRGYVTVDPAEELDTDGVATVPTFTFWHIWDLNPNTDVKLEMATYVPPADPTPPDVGPGTWTTVWETAGGTRNYEWTQEEILLDGSNPGGFSAAVGDHITYRFVIENNNGGGGRKRWYVDDIRIGNRNLPDLTMASSLTSPDTFGICADTTTCETYWDFSDPTDVDDFRTTGRWALTNTGARANQGLGDDPGNRYSLEDGADLGADPLDRRIYWVEFDRPIDVSATTTNGTDFVVDAVTAPADSDNDQGAPMLTLWNSYNIQDNVSLQVQYYDETEQSWQLLREIVKTGSGAEASASTAFVQVQLNEREVADSNGLGTGVFDTYDTAAAGSTVWQDWANGPIRVRMAMIVLETATFDAANGWTIDEIQIERLGVFDYIPYPFDQTGDPELADLVNNWQRTGTWAFTEERPSRDGNWVLSDSPNSDYLASTDTFTETRALIDLNSDTPENPYSQACTENCLNPEDNSTRTPGTGGYVPAVDPQITFWWRRGLASPARLTVEIRTNAGEDAPVTVWEYNYDSSNATQTVWERVEIDLDPFINDETDTGNADVYDDDIIISFNLSTGSTQADGVYIDEFLLADSPVARSFRLWEDDDLPDEDDGDGRRYIDTVDARTNLSDDRDNCDGDSDDNSETCDDTGGRWFDRWHYGGNWFSGFYEYTYLDQNGDEQTDLIARSGTQVFHESPTTSENPLNGNPDDDDNFFYQTRSFSVLEMIRTIDMTGLETERATGDPVGIATAGDNGSPIMYWWQRYDRGVNGNMLVQVATREATSPDEYRAGDPLSYGDDELYGWSEWQTIYYANGDDENYAWTRQGVNLANAPIYNANGDIIDRENFIGDELRVRFVLDALDVTGDQSRDGWFVDDIEFTVQVPVITNFTNDPELTTWVQEGTWGEDPNKFEGGTSIANFPGSNWNVNWLNCNYRPNENTGAAASGDQGCSNKGNNLNKLLADPDYRSYYGTANPNNWYLNETLPTGLPFEYTFENTSGTAGRPPGARNNRVWHDNFAAEFQRTIEVAEANVYDFYVRTDDGVRVGITDMPTTAELDDVGGAGNSLTAAFENVPVDGGSRTYTDSAINGTNPIYYGNVIDQWRGQAPTVYTRSVGLVTEPDGSPREYILTIHYYEGGSGGVIAFGMGTGETSLTDSPVAVPVEDIEEDFIPANYLSNTSIVYDGLIDLRTANKPVLNYYTTYALSNINATAYLEVSNDGGFTWSESGLQGIVTTSDGTSFSATGSTNWSGTEDNWVFRQNTLESYNGELIGMRFRLDVGAGLNQMQTQENNDRGDGVYIDEVLVFDLEPDNPAPQIVFNPPVSVFVSEGGTPQQLSVLAVGTAPLRYEWYKGEQPADPNAVPTNATLIAGATTSTFTPPATLEPGLHTYWVRVSNSVSDADPNIPPAQSIPTEYRVLECLPTDVGDCNIYRINVNGPDVDTADNTQPGWSGDLESAAAFVPSGTSFPGSDADINTPSTSDNEFIQAAIVGAAPESLYRTFRATDSDMTWSFPVEAGQYTVRLYMADPFDNNPVDDQGAFSVFVNGTVSEYITGGSTSVLNNVNFYNLVGQANQTPAVIQLAPVSISGVGDSIDLRVERNSKTTFISGIEIFPVTDTEPEITDEPDDTLADGSGQATVTVAATGANLAFQWYVDGTPITNGGPYEIVESVGNLSGNSRLVLKTLNAPPAPEAPVNVYVEVTNTESGTTVTSRTALVSDNCVFDPNTPGSCDRWYINVGDNDSDGAITASDSGETIRWASFTTPYSNGTPIYESNADPSFYQRNEALDDAPWTYNFLVDSAFIPRSVFVSYIDSADPAGFDFTLPVSSGSYDATFFFADNNSSRVDITIEGSLRVDNFTPVVECSTNQYCSATVLNIPVTDGNININIKRDSTAFFPARLNALSVTRR